MQRGKPARRTQLMNLDDYTIVSIYSAEYRGTVQYYLLASDVYRLNRLNWVMETSMLKTLAASTARPYRRPRRNIKPKSTPPTDAEAPRPIVARARARSGDAAPHRHRRPDGIASRCESNGP
jgi:Type II intron maturase